MNSSMADATTPVRSRSRLFLAIQSVAAIAFGILTFVWPGATLEALLLLFGIFLIVFGAAALIGAFVARRVDSVWWLGVVAGVAGIVAGVMSLAWPGVTAITLLYLLAAWAIIMGIAEIGYAIRSRYRTSLRVIYGFAGLLSVALGILLIAIRPDLGVLAVLWIIGLYAIINGLLWGYCALVGERPISLRRGLMPDRDRRISGL